MSGVVAGLCLIAALEALAARDARFSNHVRFGNLARAACWIAASVVIVAVEASG